MTEHPKPRPPGDRVPKYYALKQELLKRIESLEPGDALPAERTLTVLYSTSRTTVRQAIQALIVEGRLQRLHGSGTFVTRPKVAQVLQLTGYTEDMRLLGLEPSSHLLQVREVRADPVLAERLGVVVGEHVHCLERLRMANGEPMAIETTHLAARRYPRLRQHLDRLGSLYQLLDQVYGVRLKEAEETIETVLARPHEAALLGTDVGVPMLLLSRHSFDEEGQPVEYVKSIYRGDRYKFVAWLRRSGYGEERPKNLHNCSGLVSASTRRVEGARIVGNSD